MLYLLVYSAVLILLVYWRERSQKQTAEHFLLANREVSGARGAMSIAASWIWAPALFVSTQVGYQWGYSALVWFVLPNAFSLILFVGIAGNIRRRLPQGFSYIEHLRDSARPFRITQLSIQLLMQLLIFALQLTAGAELLSFVSGASYTAILTTMLFTALAYSLVGGLHSSVFTDAWQYCVIAVAIVAIYISLPANAFPSIDELPTFSPFDSTMLSEFGVASAVGLLFAIFADHQQWQRLFAVKEAELCRTFVVGSVLHAAVTFSLGTLGVIVAANGFQASKLQLVGIEYIQTNLPEAVTSIFIVMALCGLCSTLDSCLCAFSSLYSTELSRSRDKIRSSRKAMIALAGLGFAIALLQLPLITLWFLISTIRLAAFAPTVTSILKKDYSGQNGVLAICAGLLAGGGIFLFGIIVSDPWIRTTGMIVSIGMSSLVCLPSFLPFGKIRAGINEYATKVYR